MTALNCSQTGNREYKTRLETQRCRIPWLVLRRKNAPCFFTRIRKSEAQWAAFEAVTINGDTSVFVKSEFKFMPATEAYTENNTALYKMAQDFILQVLAGTRTVDDLPAFQKEWANNEGEAVRAELQAYYDGLAK